MKSGMSTRTRVLLGVAACAAAVLAVQRLKPGQVAPHPPVAASGVPRGPLRDGVPGADEAALPPALAATAPDSPWLTRRSHRYAALYDHWHCDLLLVPMQVEGGGFDRPSRDIMTADLALALEAASPCVADPYLVDIALGDGLRRRDPAAVLALAHRLHAGRIVSVFAGHYRPGQMRVTLQLQTLADSPGASPVMAAAHSFDKLSYSDTDPPLLAFRRALPQMLAALGLPGPRQAPAVAAGALPAQLPQTFDSYLDAPAADAAPDGPLARAARLSFLAILTPSNEWRATDRLFSKAWVALEGADDANPAVRRMRARILFHLYERPLALQELGEDPAPESVALRALLDGNLPQARKALAAVRQPWERFFLDIEVHDLELIYQRDPRASGVDARAPLRQSVFLPFVRRRLLDDDYWSYASTVDLKQLLDRWLPLPNFTLADVTGGRPIEHAVGLPDVELAALRHVHRLVQEQPQRWCCAGFTTAPRASDLLDMLDSRIELAVGRQPAFFVETQGQPERALAVLESYDAELAGSPCTENLRAEIDWKLLRKGQFSQQDALNRNMHQAARLAAWWDQGQSTDSNDTFWYLTRPPEEPALKFLVRITDDYPMRPYWRFNLHKPTAQARLAFSAHDPGPLSELIDASQGARRDAYIALLDTRFLGGAWATRMRLDHMPKADKTQARLHAEIGDDPDNWELYRGLGDLQFDAGDFESVARTILSYPPFGQRDPKDPVALSNDASTWGHDLLWQGAFGPARTLLEKSAAYDTGSADCVFAQARLALLDGHFAQAAVLFMNVARTYDDFDAWRELDSLLYAAGVTHVADGAFEDISRNYRAHGFWTAAIVGHRRANMSAEAVGQWYQAHLAAQKHGEDRDNLRYLAFVEALMDRAPRGDLATAMRALEGSSEVHRAPKARVLLGDTSPGVRIDLGPGGFGAGRLPPGGDIPDRYVLAAQAIQDLQARHYPASAAAFERLTAYYQIEKGPMGLLLPDFAYAAARSGDTYGLAAYLDSLPDGAQTLAVLLARAQFAAAAGKPDAALALLEKARRQWPYETGQFPLQAYEYLDTATQLYGDTHDERYRDAALALARPLRRTEPALAFAHALVARLGRDPAEQLDALADALYLDPQSWWASQTPFALQDAARARLAREGNPFRQGEDADQWKYFESGAFEGY